MKRRSPVFTLFITIFIDLLGFGIVIPKLPNIAKALALHDHFIISPDISAGLVMAVFSLMQFLFAPIWGTLSDKIGRRPIILGSVLCTGLGYFIMGFGTTVMVVFIARAICGIGSANISAAQAYIADITPPEQRAKRMGLIGAAFGLGFVFGPPLGGLLYDWGSHIFHIGAAQVTPDGTIYPSGGLRMMGYAIGILALGNFILAWFNLPESLKEKNTDKKKFFQAFEGLSTVWKIDIVGELFIIGFIYTVAFSLMQANASLLWEEKYSLTTVQISYLFGLIGLCSAVIQGGMIGFFQRMIGLKKMLLWGCLIVGLGLIIMPLPNKEMFYAVQITAIILLCIGNGFLMPAINSFVSVNTSAENQGKILGLLQGVGSLGRTVGPAMAGVFYGLYIPLPYLVGGVLMVLAFYFAWKLYHQLKDIKSPEHHGIDTELTDEVII